MVIQLAPVTEKEAEKKQKQSNRGASQTTTSDNTNKGSKHKPTETKVVNRIRGTL